MPGAIGWAPALLPPRGGVIAHPKVQSRNSDSARCDWEIEVVAEAALLPVAPTLRTGKLDRPVKYRRFRRTNILAIRDRLEPRTQLARLVLLAQYTVERGDLGTDRLDLPNKDHQGCARCHGQSLIALVTDDRRQLGQPEQAAFRDDAELA